MDFSCHLEMETEQKTQIFCNRLLSHFKVSSNVDACFFQVSIVDLEILTKMALQNIYILWCLLARIIKYLPKYTVFLQHRCVIKCYKKTRFTSEMLRLHMFASKTVINLQNYIAVQSVIASLLFYPKLLFCRFLM